MEAQTTSTAPIILVGSLSAGWFSASPQCPSGSPIPLGQSSRLVQSSRIGFLSLPQVGLAGTQTDPSWGQIPGSKQKGMCSAGYSDTGPAGRQHPGGTASQSKCLCQPSPSPGFSHGSWPASPPPTSGICYDSPIVHSSGGIS